MTRTTLTYVASAVLGIAMGVATLGGANVLVTSGAGVPCQPSDPSCDEVQPTEQIEVACNSHDCDGGVQSSETVELACNGPDCQGDVQPTKQVEVACDGPDCDGGYRSDERIGLPCELGVDCAQHDERIEVACNGPDCSGDYRSDENILIALANRGVEGGNG